MKCVCDRDCQTRVGGKIVFFNQGMVESFDKCPPNFSPIDNSDEVDFLTTGEDALMAMDWKFSQAAEAIKTAFNIDLVKGPKTAVVDQILDARYRSLDIDPNKV